MRFPPRLFQRSWHIDNNHYIDDNGMSVLKRARPLKQEAQVALRSRAIAFLVLLGMIAAGAASAQQTVATTFTGTATSAGVVKRTIIDITKPGIVPNGARSQGTQVCGLVSWSFYISAPAGKTQNQIGLIYRNAANAAAAAQDPCPGYSAYFCFAAPDSHAVALNKPLGTYSITDSGGIPGVTIANQTLTQNNGPAASSTGTAALGLLLAAASVIILRGRAQS